MFYMTLSGATMNIEEQYPMYQIIDGQVVQVVRWGDQLLPITDPLTRQTIGQLTLELTYED